MRVFLNRIQVQSQIGSESYTVICAISAHFIISQSQIGHFVIGIYNQNGSQSVDPINMMLYWDDELINCTVQPSSYNFYYICDDQTWTKSESGCTDIGERWMKISGGINDGVTIDSIVAWYINTQGIPDSSNFDRFCTSLNFTSIDPTAFDCDAFAQNGHELKDYLSFCLGKDCSTTMQDTLYLNLTTMVGDTEDQVLLTNIPPNITFQCTLSNQTPSSSPTNTPSSHFKMGHKSIQTIKQFLHTV